MGAWACCSLEGLQHLVQRRVVGGPADGPEAALQDALVLRHHQPQRQVAAGSHLPGTGRTAPLPSSLPSGVHLPLHSVRAARSTPPSDTQ